jgi:hypothetical protein
VGEDRRTSGTAPYTAAEAADMLGITTGAVRIRLSCATLPRVREGGTVYVLLPADMSRDTDRYADDVPTGMPHGEPDTLTSELRDRLRYVEGQLEAERQAHSEARKLLAAALERIPAIEAPQETQESPETVDEQQGRGERCPTPLRERLRKAYRGRKSGAGGGGY